MNKLNIYTEDAKLIHSINNNLEIAEALKEVGVDFTQWSATQVIEKTDSNEMILKAYNDSIQQLIQQKGYQTVDVISLSPDHPDKKALREKFLSEHTHSEDEVRFFVKGKGLFTMHIGEKVYSILCEKGDLISVPANATHWFDMGENPQFTCIRLFNNPEGWVAKYTGNQIAEKFPCLEL